jgi:hypothetical protein
MNLVALAEWSLRKLDFLRLVALEHKPERPAGRQFTKLSFEIRPQLCVGFAGLAQ